MAAPRIARGLAQRWQQGVRRAQRLDQRTHGWLGMLLGAAQQALKPESAITAAAIAYFAIFSLFPLTLLSIAIASFSLGPLMDQHLIVQRLEFVAPALGQLVGENIDEIIRARGPVTIVALGSLIWSASTMFFVLTGTLNEIWGIERRRPIWKRRGLAILFVLAIVGPILFLASFGGSLLANFLTWMPERIMQIGGGISLCVALLLDVALFMVVYLMLPHTSFELARDFSRRAGSRPALGACQESLPVLYCHLYLRLEPGLWFRGSHYRDPDLGLPEQPDLSLWRLRECRLSPAAPGATRSRKQKTNLGPKVWIVKQD